MSRLERVVPPSRARIEHLEATLHAIKNDLVAAVDRTVGESAAVHDRLSDQYGVLSGQLVNVEDRLQSLQFFVEVVLERIGVAVPPQGNPTTLEDIDLRAARFLNQVYAADGPLRESGLFVNHPLTVLWHPGEARVENVNERIVEIPFVHRALAGVPVGSTVLDVGGGESTVGLELASLGYRTTVLEPRGYPFRHPNLTVAPVYAEEYEPPGGPVDACVLLSTIEHLGVGAYSHEQDADLDLSVMRRLWDLVVPGGLLVLSTPFGRAARDELQRTYDLDRLRRLLTGWTPTAVELVRREDATTWVMDDASLSEASRSDASRVVLVTATRAGDPDTVSDGLG